MNRIISVGAVLLLLQTPGLSYGGYNIISDKLAMPCERTVELQAITKAVIPMTPMRSVNIIFPYKLPDDTTTYVLSGSNVWEHHKAHGGSIVPVTFKKIDESLFGEVQDLTISTSHHLISLALKADPDIRHHCTNIVLKLPPEEKRRLEEKEKHDHLALLDAEYQKKVDALDQKAMEMALSYVGSLANHSPKTTRIFEETEIANSDGERIQLYVDKVESYGKFNIIRFEVKNGSGLTPVNIDSVTAGIISESGQRMPINGYADYQRRLGTNQTANYLFTTLEIVPDSNGFLTLETDQGKLEVLW
jgi:hypothetical protein